MKRVIQRKKIGIMNTNSSNITRSKRLISTFALIVLSLFFTRMANAQDGESLFKTNCGACHRVSTDKLVGPGLKGIADKHSEEWFVEWVKDPQAMIAKGDKDAVAVHKANNGVMPPVAIPESDIKSIYSYIDKKSNEVATTPAVKEDTGAEVATSDFKNTNLFWGVIALLVIGALMYRMIRRAKETAQGMGAFKDPHYVKNFPLIFLLYLCAAGVIIYLIYLALTQKMGQIDNLMFKVLPYLSLAIFIVASVYRWTKKGYKVSSLSTQFIEGRKLFWGSQPFHWGLVVLFFGHLTAFLFPSWVLAWNGEPVRLLILEISSFVFALGALIGLVMLIIRRLSSKSLLVVTNKMDMVVYTVLLIQIISGLGVAFYVRWGSSWFASVLTPYLRSIFTFDPDISAIASAPILVKIHVISAFLIIAIIPFSRFIHFLVAPIDYLWRSYQQVVWNWNPKFIRKSTRHTFGKRPRNH